MLPAHFHDVTYDHIWSKYCRGSQRVQQEIKEQSSNPEEEATQYAELNMSIPPVNNYKTPLTL